MTAITMLVKRIQFFGRPVAIVCDGRCDKAFGIDGRPRRMLSDDEDDYVYLGDDEVGDAPPPGETETISEGTDVKPSEGPFPPPERMNRWCARQCERSALVEGLPSVRDVRDLHRPRPNQPWRRASLTPGDPERNAPR